MKGKVIIFILVFFLLAGYLSYLLGWVEFKKDVSTPKAFLSSVTIDSDNYKRDSLRIIDQLKGPLSKHEDFFNNSAYYDSTQLIVDTIVYSSDHKKLAAIIITKNPVQRLLVPDKNYSSYYDATSYLGLRQGDTISLRWLGPVLTNSYDQNDMSKSIREECFVTFAGKSNSSGPQYNLNDSRFWDSGIWGKYFGVTK